MLNVKNKSHETNQNLKNLEKLNNVIDDKRYISERRHVDILLGAKYTGHYLNYINRFNAENYVALLRTKFSYLKDEQKQRLRTELTAVMLYYGMKGFYTKFLPKYIEELKKNNDPEQAISKVLGKGWMGKIYTVLKSNENKTNSQLIPRKKVSVDDIDDINDIVDMNFPSPKDEITFHFIDSESRNLNLFWRNVRKKFIETAKNGNKEVANKFFYYLYKALEKKFLDYHNHYLNEKEKEAKEKGDKNRLPYINQLRFEALNDARIKAFEFALEAMNRILAFDSLDDKRVKEAVKNNLFNFFIKELRYTYKFNLPSLYLKGGFIISAKPHDPMLLFDFFDNDNIPLDYKKEVLKQLSLNDLLSLKRNKESLFGYLSKKYKGNKEIESILRQKAESF